MQRNSIRSTHRESWTNSNMRLVESGYERCDAFEGNGCSMTFMIFWLMVMTGLSADSDFQELSS